MAILSSTGRFAAGETCADNDILYGPYATTAAAHAALLNAEQNVVGRTVGIQTGNTIEEFWYQGGTEQTNLVKKQSSDVEANPSGTPTDTLQKIKIGEIIYTAPQGPAGPQGEQGIQGETGATGATGPANTLNIGTVTDGEQAAASITGDAPNQTLNLTLPAGKSAYQIAVDNGFVGSEEQWLASLKANIGAFQFITPTDTTAEAALTAIGSTYANAIGGVSPLQSTLSIILLMNDSNNTKTMMIATQNDGNSGYEFIYAGDLQSAMPSNVLTENDVIDNLETNSSINVLSAKQGKILNQQSIYDVTAHNPTAGTNNDGKFASLSELLSDANLNTIIPTAVRCGGMSIRFVQSSDNNYIQARCMAQNFTTDVTQWQGVDSEPLAGSRNLVESGGVKKAINDIESSIYGKVTLKSDECIRQINAYYDAVRKNILPSSNNDILTLDVSGYNKVSFLGYNYPSSVGRINAGYYFFDAQGTPISGDWWKSTATGETYEKININASVPANARTLKITVRHDSDEDFYCNLISTNSIPTNLACPVIFTNGYFNADNENKVINIPAFCVFIHGVQYTITAPDLAYPATSTGRNWHALMLNESCDGVEIKTWLGIDSLSQSRLLAFINIYWHSETEPEVTIFRGSGDIWRIDGKNYNTDITPMKGSMNPVTSDGIVKFQKTRLSKSDVTIISNMYVFCVNTGAVGSLQPNENNDVFIINVSNASAVKFLGFVYKDLVNAGYVFYDKDDTPISGTRYSHSTAYVQSINLWEYIVNVPANATTLKITVRKEYKDIFYCELSSKNCDANAGSLSINGVLGGGIEKAYGSIRTKSDAVITMRHMVNSNVSDENGNRYSLVFPISKGTIIKAQCSWGKGIFADIYRNKYGSLLATDRVQTIHSSYTTDEIAGIAEYDGYLRVGTTKNDDSAITDAEIVEFIEALSLELVNYGDIGRAINSSISSSTSFLAVFTSGYFNADNTTRKIHVPEFKVWIGDHSYSISSTDIDYLSTTDRLWHALVLTNDYTSVEIVKWNDINQANTNRIIAFIISEYTSAVNMNKITAFYGNGGPQFWKIDGISNDSKTNSVIDKNQDKIPVLIGASNKGTRLTAMIITDVHTDWKQMMDAVEFANKCEYIDCVFFLGDYPELTPSMAAFDNVNLAYEACTKPFFGVIGNHDIRYGKSIPKHASIDVPTEALIEPVFQNLNIGEYATGVPYYYHDFTNRNIRVIFLCDFDMPLTYQSSEYWEAVEYDSSAPTWNNSTIYEVDDVVNFGLYKINSFRCKVQNSNKSLGLVVSDGGFRTISETQWNWLVSTLLSTPAGYKVVIASHIPASCGYDTHERNHKFCANRISESLIMNPLNDDYLGILAKAFNDSASGTLNISYKNVQGAGKTWYFDSLPSCTINYDFSGKNTGAEFMCFISGHTHIDFISKNSYGLYTITSKFCDHIVRQFDYNDVPTSSDDNDIARDALTVISFDTINNAVVLTRVGTTAITDGYLRDYEGIDLSV